MFSGTAENAANPVFSRGCGTFPNFFGRLGISTSISFIFHYVIFPKYTFREPESRPSLRASFPLCAFSNAYRLERLCSCLNVHIFGRNITPHLLQRLKFWCVNFTFSYVIAVNVELYLKFSLFLLCFVCEYAFAARKKLSKITRKMLICAAFSDILKQKARCPLCPTHHHSLSQTRC